VPDSGKVLSHYQILRPLGKGGMGEVFLAEDTVLGRKVAVKFLPEEALRDSAARTRFLREAKSAAALDDPFICKIYETGEADGRPFIVMEYVEGESLRSRLDRGTMPLPDVVTTAIEVAEALGVAHQHGIIHRDLKPSNIMLTPQGHAKVLDFGLAKQVQPLGKPAGEVETATSADLTAWGTTVGTLAYMSPEQLRAEPLGPSSDVFSLGVVLQEMLTGRHPFDRPSAAETITAIMNDQAPPLEVAGIAIPEGLGRVLGRALAKNPQDRYPSAVELAVDLQSVSPTLVETRKQRPTLTLVASAVAAVAVVVAIGAWWLVAHRKGPTVAAVPPAPRSVLVADFQNTTGEPVFDGVLEQAVSIGLEGAPFIQTFSRAKAHKVAAEIHPGSTGLGLETARLVAQREGIAVVVAGGIKRAGQGYDVEVEALDGVSGKRLADHTQDVPGKDGVLGAIGELVVETRRDLGDVIPDSVRAVASETFTAGSLEAASSYAKAQDLMAAGKWREAIPVYQNALQLDPTFGRAYAGLAVCYLNLNQTEEAKKYYEKAFSLIDRMTDREKYRTRGGYYLLTRNYAKAAEEYKALSENYPSDPAGPTNLAFAYFYARDMLRAVETGRLAVQRYPDNVLARANLALYAMYAGDFATAAREAEAVLAANPGYETAYVAAAMARLDAGDIEGARGYYTRLRAVSPYGASLAATGLADIALFQGATKQALDVLEKGVAGDTATGLEAEAARKDTMIAAAFLSRDETRPAVAAADRALALSKRNYILLSAGLTLAAAGDEKRAHQMAATLASKIEPEPRCFAKLLEGEVLLHKGQPNEAAVRFHEAGDIVDTWLGRYLLGRAYLEAGAFTEADSELEICLKRRGEATAVFLDDVPSYYLVVPVYYWLGRAQEGLGSPKAADSYRKFLELRAKGEDDPLVLDARRRLQTH
jgi:tetratricopeptide (TPR) repeat protein/tRNA A-37 threonylcarbamoyl transferase component Bud32